MPKWTEESAEVPFAALPVLVGRAADCDWRLSEPTVSRHHARIYRRGGDVVVLDQESRFGTFVNGQRVRERVLRREDRVRFGMRLSYVVRENALEPEGGAKASLEIRDVAIARQGRRLVDGVSAVLEPGKLVGLLGPSGLGKTLLLRALAGYYQPDAGRVVWGGRDVWEQREEYLAQVGFIPQADVLYETLSVRENLEHAARLRLPNLAAPAQAELIREVLELLQLTEHAAKRAAVLSGGQRKRLSVAIELLRNPPILLLDEPTTGLDPGNEARLVENLRQVAKRGTLVVLSTHSLAALRLFDEVLVLARYGGVGRMAYGGPPETLEKRLAGMHPADWYDALEQGRVMPEVPGGQAASPWGAAASRIATTEVGSAEDSAPEGSAPPLALSVRQIARRQSSGGWWRQWLDVAARCAKGIARDRALVAMIVFQPILLGLLVILSQSRATKLDPIQFFTVVVALWLGMNNTVRDLVRERRHYLRDRMAGLRAEAYLAAKVAVYVVIGAAQLWVFLLLVRWGCGQVLEEHMGNRLHEAGGVGWLTTLGLVYLCGVGLGMLVSTLSRTEETAVAALPLLILPQILLSAVATNEMNTAWSQPRIFRPIVVTLRPGLGEAREQRGDNEDFWRIGWAGTTTDVLSMFCYSRPALLVLERPVVPGYSTNIWWGDLFHLLVLLFATHAAMWGLFLRCESRWPALAAL